MYHIRFYTFCNTSYTNELTKSVSHSYTFLEFNNTEENANTSTTVGALYVSEFYQCLTTAMVNKFTEVIGLALRGYFYQQDSH